jgi:glutathione S-transferase
MTQSTNLTTNLKVYGGTQNRGFRIYWLLEELGLAYEGYDVKLFEGQQLQPTFLKLNPHAKVPVIMDEDFVLSESGAILNYLAGKYGNGILPATGTKERAIYDQWFCFCLTELEPPIWTASKHSYIYKADRRVSAIIDSSKFEFKKACQKIVFQLGDQEYILGSFSNIDILVGQMLIWASALLGFEISDASLVKYLARIQARDGFKRASQKELKHFE